MNGIIVAVAAGLMFGLFQTISRRTNQLLDAYRATFATLLVGLVTLATWVALTQDLGVLGEAPVTAYLAFAGAGIVHFVAGWTLMALSHQRVGAARTSALVATQPLFAAVFAALFLAEPLTAPMLAGVVLVIAGLVALSMRQGVGEAVATTPWFGLAAGAAWGSSPIFIRTGLDRLPSPLIGVTVGLLGAALAYGILLPATRGRRLDAAPVSSALRWVVAAGVVVAVAIALQWTSYDLIPIAVAVTLLQLATPVVLVAAPILIGTPAERITPLLLLGAAAVLAGSTLVVVAGSS